MKLKKLFVILVALFVLSSASSVLASQKSDFMYLYRTEWARANLKYKLFGIIDSKFTENSKSMNFSSFILNLGSNKNNIIEKIQRDIFTGFSKDYGELLDHLKRRLPENHEQIKLEAEKDFIDNLWPKLKPNLTSPLCAANWLVLGTIIFLCRGIFSNFVGSRFRNSNKATRYGKILFSAIGVIILVFGAYQASLIAGSTKAIARKFIYENTRDFYALELPEIYTKYLN